MFRSLDLLTALRRLRKRPTATVLAVASLALATAALICVSAIVQGVLLRPLPFPDAGRLVHVNELAPSGHPMPVAEPNLHDLAARHGGFEGLAFYAGAEATVSRGERLARTGTYAVSADFFRVLGTAPLRGRGFGTAEEAAAVPVALVSERLLPALFADGVTEGRSLRVFDREFEVVGVMPARFAFPADAGIWVSAEIWTGSTSRTAHNWQVLGRLRPGVQLGQAQADALAIGAAIRQAHGEDEVDLAGFGVTPLREHIARGVRGGLIALLAATAVLLLAAVANAANVALARHVGRRGELAVRAALGANGARLRREALAEGLLLGLLAAVIGTLLAWRGADALVALAGVHLPRGEEIALGLPALLPAWALALLAACGASVAPMLRGGADGALRPDSARSSAGTAPVRARRVLLVGQMAFATMLLVAVGLLARTFVGLMTTDPGFDPQGAVVVELALPDDGQRDGERIAAFHRRLSEAVAAVPAIASAGTINALPMSGRGADGGYRRDGATGPAGYAEYRVADPDYFAAAGIPLLHGRLPGPGDHAQAPHVAVVSARVAAQAWPGEDPLGKRLAFGNMDGDDTPMTVIGVVGDVAENGLERGPSATVYVPVAQRPQRAAEFALVARGPAPVPVLSAAVQEALAGLLPGTPLRIRPLAGQIEESLAFRRFVLVVFGLLSGLAVLLAVAGAYSLTLYLVGERRREMAIRMSLGAPPARARRLLLRDGWRLQALGIALGLGAAMAGSRWIGGLLHGVEPLDPATYVVAALLLAAAGLLACWWPTRDIQRIDPMSALRGD